MMLHVTVDCKCSYHAQPLNFGLRKLRELVLDIATVCMTTQTCIKRMMMAYKGESL